MPSVNTIVREQEVKIREDDSNLVGYQEKDYGMIAEKHIPSLLTHITLQSAFTTAGDYEEVIRLPEPIYAFHRAVPGTVEEFQGRLKEIFPELSTITKEDLDKISRKRGPSY